MSESLKLGQIITEPQERDAIHIAVVPVVAGDAMRPGEQVQIAQDKAWIRTDGQHVGVVDPYLHRNVMPGERFWLFLNPGSITSLRHDWTHPAFPSAPSVNRSRSEQWMREWAKEHMSYDDYDDEVSDDMAYAKALRAGSTMSVGCNESARDHIDSEWWTHWEAITGQKGERDGYFSCAC